MSINVLALLEQTNSTVATSYRISNLISYRTAHPEAKLRYLASDMKVNIHRDTSYISEREAKSRSGGLFSMGSDKDSRIDSSMVQF
jgi:hypothetical protein